MRTKVTNCGHVSLSFGVREHAVVNFSDPAEGRRYFDRYADSGFGGHGKRLSYAVAFGVGVVHCEAGCDDELVRFYDSVPSDDGLVFVTEDGGTRTFKFAPADPPR
jgi:hypothetical protein